jgi:hypothetical protein
LAQPGHGHKLRISVDTNCFLYVFAFAEKGEKFFYADLHGPQPAGVLRHLDGT